MQITVGLFISTHLKKRASWSRIRGEVAAAATKKTAKQNNKCMKHSSNKILKQIHICFTALKSTDKSLDARKRQMTGLQKIYILNRGDPE